MVPVSSKLHTAVGMVPSNSVFSRCKSFNESKEPNVVPKWTKGKLPRYSGMDPNILVCAKLRVCRRLEAPHSVGLLGGGYVRSVQDRSGFVLAAVLHDRRRYKSTTTGTSLSRRPTTNISRYCPSHRRRQVDATSQALAGLLSRIGRYGTWCPSLDRILDLPASVGK